jgi:hypothetical protein
MLGFYRCGLSQLEKMIVFSFWLLVEDEFGQKYQESFAD